MIRIYNADLKSLTFEMEGPENVGCLVFTAKDDNVHMINYTHEIFNVNLG